MKTKNKKKPVGKDAWYVLSLCGQLGFVIALPITVLAYLGQFLDKKFATSPLFILTGIALSMIISGIVIWRLIKKMES